MPSAVKIDASAHAKPIVSLQKSTINVTIDSVKLSALIDGGSSESFIHPKIVEKLKLNIQPCASSVTMASGAHSSLIKGRVTVDLKIEDINYTGVKLYIMEDLCMDIILGLDFQSRHQSVTLQLGGEKPPLVICGLSTLAVEPPSLFENLSPECKPVAAKSQR